MPSSNETASRYAAVFTPSMGNQCEEPMVGQIGFGLAELRLAEFHDRTASRIHPHFAPPSEISDLQSPILCCAPDFYPESFSEPDRALRPTLGLHSFLGPFVPKNHLFLPSFHHIIPRFLPFFAKRTQLVFFLNPFIPRYFHIFQLGSFGKKHPFLESPVPTPL